MKRTIVIVMLIIMLCVPLFICAGCEVEDDGRLKIVVTIFPEYDWVMNVLGTRASEVDVTFLLDTSADLHSYQPTAMDILKLAKADLFVYVGGESDEKWIPKALENATNPSMHTISLIETLGDAAKEEEIVEGMQVEEEEEEIDKVHAEAEYDEHVWLSLRNAARFVKRIADELSLLDVDNAQVYQRNALDYIDSLGALDEAYTAMVEAAARDTILVADRFPFRYLVDDYAIKYYAAFLGCSADSEVNQKTIADLTKKVNELDIRVLLVIESSDKRIAQTLLRESERKDQEILVLDSLQSASKKEYESGRTYLSVMEKNLETLEAALR